MAPLPFVGRRDVLAAIADAAGRTRHGHGGLLAVTGPAGAGKTRTAEESATRTDGFRTLWTWCPPEAAGSPFRPWARLLRDLTAADADCAGLVRASPPLRALTEGRTARLLRAPDPEGARLRLTADTADLLRTAAAARPLLIVLDDLHAADPSSLHLLLELAATARNAPLLLLATARDDDAPWAGRTADRAELLRRARTLPLGPLTPPDIARLLAAATGGPADPDRVGALARRTGGDAFFLTELLQSPQPMPAGVRAAVAARLDTLAAETRRAVRTAAALGTRFPLDTLARTLGTAPADLRPRLADAVAAGLLADLGPDTAAFRHDLLREAVQDTVPAADRPALHRRIAAALTGDHRADPAETARHLLLAGPEHRARAAAEARRAGDRAA
ncbi:ATP-binding protein, partial [Kitasatospora sp. DSM 101779]|uniref:ATP-binding protein n=1 Tax=Kitasatospora sp. DSM 101779 TaxID=2853165 RepID=UPI0021D8AE22